MNSNRQQSLTKDGFVLRGADMTRLETFTDAAFAFAVTLLVVGGADSIPTNFDQMIAAMKQIPAFAACFANIMFFWYAHHIWSRRFGLEDGVSTVLSLLLVFVILIYVYPLKAIYSGAIEFFSGGYFASYFSLRSVQDLRVMFVIFGVGYAAVSGLIVLLNLHAARQAGRLGLSDRERFETQSEQQHWLIHTILPVFSILLAVTMPNPLVVTAGMIYASFGVLLPLHSHLRHKKAKHLLA